MSDDGVVYVVLSPTINGLGQQIRALYATRALADEHVAAHAESVPKAARHGRFDLEAWVECWRVHHQRIPEIG